MKLLSLTLSSLLLCINLQAEADISQKVSDFAKKIASVEGPSCVNCTSSTLTVSTVEKINKKNRLITLKNDAGKKHTFTAPEEVRNFNQINVGDIVTVKTSVDTDIVVTRGALEERTRTVKETMTRSKLGEKPNTKLKKTTVDQAKVIDLEFKTQTVTLESMHGIFKMVAKNPEHYKTLRVGDIVDAISSKTIEINVTTPAKKL